MVNEYVVNTHRIENVKLKPPVKEFPNIHVQCREKSTIKKYQFYFIHFLARAVVKCFNTRIAGQTN